MNKQAFVETTCQQIYPKAREFFNSACAKNPAYDGFCILQGPPFFQPPILFIGYQPGRREPGQQNRELEWEHTWPPECNNAKGTYKLSRKLQSMFQAPYLDLEECVGMNAIFLRSDDSPTFKKAFKAELADIERFCIAKTHQVIEAIDPLKIAAIGLETGRLLAEDWETVEKRKNGDILVQYGWIAGKNAIAFAHPTGTWGISKAELDIIRDRVLTR
jgi:hypothetical protein